MAKRIVISGDFGSLDSLTLIDIKELVSRYPYCQCLQLMYSVNLKILDDPSFQKVLPLTAISLPNRQRLKEILGTIPSKKPISESEASSRLMDRGMWTLSQNLASEETLDLTENALPLSSRSSMPLSSGAEAYKTRIKQLQDGLAAVEHSKNEEEVAKPKPKKTVSQKTPKRKAKVKGDEKTKTEMQQTKSLSKEDLINRFLQQPERILIRPDASKDYSAEVDTGSLNEDFSMGSETLAQLYLSQGAVDKAIEIYKHLSLKYPEKSSFFAREIKKATKKIKQQNK